MARTCQRVIDRAREILQDADGTRYSDADLLNHIVDAIVQARSMRPDIFVANYVTPLPDSLAPSDPLPVPDQYFAAICYHVAGSAELRDDEFAADNRALTLQAGYNKKLLQGM